jgi:opacity protein-like surface antigen
MDLLRRIFRIQTLLALSAALLLLPAQAQVVPAAYNSPQSLWVGAEYSNITASFPYQSGQRLQGIGAFVDYNLNRHVGLEFDARFMPFGGFEGSTESSYLVGPRVFILERGRFRPYGKMLVGQGKIHYPFLIGDASYFALAPGAGTEFRLSHRWLLRAEYEYQMWLNSPGYANEPNHQLNPNGFHIGIAYKLLPW